MNKSNARPVRTFCKAPGDDEEAMLRLVAARPDAVVFDLEEPRLPYGDEDRAQARALVAKVIAGMPGGPEAPLVFVRVSATDTGETLRDLLAVVGERLAGVMQPKVYGPREIHEMDALLRCVEREASLPSGEIVIYPILETASSIRLAFEIGSASDRVAYMGGAVSRYGDIYQDLGYTWTPTGEETLFLRQKVLVDARAAGIRYPISGGWAGRRDDVDGFCAWARHLRGLGYFGMQVPVEFIAMANEIFVPSPSDIAYWQAVVSAVESSGDGRALYGEAVDGEGHVLHAAHYGSAKQDLVWARELGIS